MSDRRTPAGMVAKANYTERWKASNRDMVNATHRAWLKERGGAATYRRMTQVDRVRMLGSIKDQPCADCGGIFAAVAMDFDHVRGEKVKSVSWLVRNASWDRVMDEIAKCELVCANCHRVRTAARGDASNWMRREAVA